MSQESKVIYRPDYMFSFIHIPFNLQKNGNPLPQKKESKLKRTLKYALEIKFKLEFSSFM